MARTYRYRSYRRGWNKRRYKRYFRKYWRRYSRKYINGSSKSTIRVKTSWTTTATVSAGYGTTAGAIVYSSPYAGVASEGSLAHSQLYQTYCSLYEEVKIIGVKVNMAVITPVGDTTTPSLQIYSAWDRKRGDGEAAPTGPEIIQSSTSAVATAINNSVAKISRSCWASDLVEKATWIDSTLNAGGGNEAWDAAGLNPNMFCPSFMWTLVSPSLGAAHNVSVSISYTYYIAFRNPKYGGSTSSKDAAAAVGDMDDYGVDAAGSDGDVSIPSTRTLAHSSVVADRSDPILSSRPSRKERRGVI